MAVVGFVGLAKSAFTLAGEAGAGATLLRLLSLKYIDIYVYTRCLLFWFQFSKIQNQKFDWVGLLRGGFVAHG